MANIAKSVNKVDGTSVVLCQWQSNEKVFDVDVRKNGKFVEHITLWLTNNNKNTATPILEKRARRVYEALRNAYGCSCRVSMRRTK